MELFKQLNLEQKKTIVLITHDQHIAEYAKKIVRMQDGNFLN